MTPQGTSYREVVRPVRIPICASPPLVTALPDRTGSLDEGCSPPCDSSTAEIVNGHTDGSQASSLEGPAPSSSLPPIGGERASPLSNAPAARKNILIVDDEISIRESLAAVLREEGYTVELAENGRIAIREFLHGSPDLILLDLNMPDTDGWKAFDLLARLAPDVPVVMITARADQQKRAQEAGVKVLLEKPLDIPVLLNAIRVLFNPG